MTALRARYSSVFIAFLSLLFVPAGLQANTTYSSVEAQFKRGEQPDSTVIDQLPSPETAREFALRARLQLKWPDARADWKEAVERSDSPVAMEHNLREWLKIGLFQEGNQDDLRWLKKILSERSRKTTLTGETWFLAGQLETLHGNHDRALRYLRKIPEQSDRYPNGLLARAKHALESGKIDRAGELLNRFFLQPDRPDHPRYWLLKGQYFQKNGSDSEAYIAYSHLINYYPDYYLRSRAEDRIAKLPLPPALYPESSSSRISPETNDGTNQSVSATGEQYQVQAGSFRDRSHARQLRRAIRGAIEYPVKIMDSRVNGTIYYRVRIKKIPSRSHAEKLIDRLESLGYDGFIVNR